MKIQSKQERNTPKSDDAHKRLKEVAVTGGNIFEQLMDTLKGFPLPGLLPRKRDFSCMRKSCMYSDLSSKWSDNVNFFRLVYGRQEVIKDTIMK